MKRRISTLLWLALLLSMLPVTAFAKGTLPDNGIVNVSLPVTYGQTEAREMLHYINNFRTGSGEGSTTNPPQALDENENWVDYPGLKPLKYDYGLEKVAMQRAAEIAISFEHTRPNGAICFTAGDPMGISYYGENIAAGMSTAYSTFIQFREDNMSYDEQGHRRLMLSSDVQTIGIGHVVYRGQHYWAHAFGGAPYDSNETPAVDAARNVPIEIAPSKIKTGSFDHPYQGPITLDPTITLSEDTLEMNVGDTVDAPDAMIQFWLENTFPDWNHPQIKPSAEINVQWVSDQNFIVAVEGNQIQALQAGTAQLSGTVLGENLTLTVHVTKPITYTPVMAEEATCTTNGRKAHFKGSDGKLYIDDGAGNKKQVTEEELVIPAKHNLQFVSGKEATTTETGLKPYYHCNACNKNFEDKGCTKEINGDLNAWREIPKKLKPEWVQQEGGWKYRKEDGSYHTGWLLLEGRWYYCSQEGLMLTDWQQIDGVWYYFDQDGHMLTGWQQIVGVWYYFDQDGHMLTGWQQIVGVWYYFDQSGHMLTGWQQIVGVWYYFDQDGHMLTGWQQIAGVWYYFDQDGHMLTGWQQIAGVWYYFDQDGHMLTGWQQIVGVWYYFDQDGHMLTGWQWIGGNCYYFYSSGAMAVNTTINGSYVNHSGVWVA